MILQMGLNKTGTTSLAVALRILGYDVCDNCSGLKSVIENNISRRNDPVEGIYKYNAITDNKAVWDNFEIIHELNPSLSFIYTPRDTESWLKSRMLHEDGKGRGFDMDSLRKYKIQHDERAIRFVRREDTNSLILPICDGLGNWEKLCGFLNKPIPDSPFPHKNKSHKK